MKLIDLLTQSKDHVRGLAFKAYASQLTLGFLLAVFPAMLVFASILGFWFDADFILNEGVLTFGLVIPAPVVDLLVDNLLGVLENRSLALFSIGFIILLYGVVRLLQQMMSILNDIYQVEERRVVWQRVILSLLIMAGGVVMLLAIIQLLFVTDQVLLFVADSGLLSSSFLVWRWPLVILLMFGMIYLSYVFIPDLRRHYWRENLLGATFFTLGWLIMSIIFNWYISNLADFNATYGLLGTIILTLFYLELNAYLYILGGVLNSRLIKMVESDSVWQKVRMLFS